MNLVTVVDLDVIFQFYMYSTGLPGGFKGDPLAGLALIPSSGPS